MATKKRSSIGMPPQTTKSLVSKPPIGAGNTLAQKKKSAQLQPNELKTTNMDISRSYKSHGSVNHTRTKSVDKSTHKVKGLLTTKSSNK